MVQNNIYTASAAGKNKITYIVAYQRFTHGMLRQT